MQAGNEMTRKTRSITRNIWYWQDIQRYVSVRGQAVLKYNYKPESLTLVELEFVLCLLGIPNHR